MKENQLHYNSLDGLRGLAILAVLASHLSNIHGQFFRGIGQQGVWLFFVLSAFLLTDKFVRNPGKVNSLYEWADYLFRRCTRIIPLYIIALLCYVSLGYLAYEDLFGLHFWTIPVELCFYLILPLLLLYYIKLLKQNLAFIVISLFALIVVDQIFFPESQLANWQSVVGINFLYYLPVFLYGFIISTFVGSLGPKKSYFFDLIGIILLVFEFIIMPGMWSLLIYPVAYTYYHPYPVYLSILWAVILLCILKGRLFYRFFDNAPMRWIGKISYNAYLFHLLIIYLVMEYLSESDYIFIPVSAIIILGFSSVVFLILEKPLQKLRLNDILIQLKMLIMKTTNIINYCLNVSDRNLR